MSQGLSLRWVRKREPHWHRLEELIASCGRRGVSALRHEELRELALLYRQTAADLATTRAASPTSELSRDLNQLLGRAHNLVYTALPTERHPIWRFYTRGFPQTFRATWRYTAVASLLLVAGAAAGILTCWSDPGFERFVLGSEMIDTIERHEMWTQSVLAMKPLASSGIMTNNLAVSLTACATGIFAGLGTVYMMIFNGVLLGVVATAC